MRKLFLTQAYYFWHIIKTRAKLWIIFISAIILLVGYQTYGNENVHTVMQFFNGTSFEDILFKSAKLPVLWFIYFSIPIFITLDSHKQLRKKRLAQLKGFKYSRIQFEFVSLALSICLILVYELITFIFLFVTVEIISYHSFLLYGARGATAYFYLFLLVFLGLAFLNTLQATFNLLNSVLGIVVPISLLIFTALTIFKYNPMNILMLLRISAKSFICDLMNLSIFCIIFTTLYLLWVSKKDFY